MKLFDYKVAPSPRRVRMFLAEKDLELEIIQVDLLKGEQHSEDFSKLNPWRTVPVLELDDGTTISEVDACCIYLEETHPEPRLLGNTPKEKAEIAMWNSHINSDGYQAAANLFRNTSKAFKNRATTGPESHAQIPEFADREKTRLLSFLKLLDERLSDRTFICTEKFTISDITAFVAIEFAKWSGVNPDTKLKSLVRWHQNISNRPSAKA